MSEQPEKKINEFEVGELFKSTYHKIAVWHNEEASQVGLKQLSMELIEDIAGAVFTHFGIKYDSGIKMDDETKKKVELEKEKIIEREILKKD